MTGQFELGSKHLEKAKTAKEFISEVEAGFTGDRNPKEVIKKYLEKTYGNLPSESEVYNGFLGAILSIEEIAKQDALSAYMLLDQMVFRQILAKYSDLKAEDILAQDETISLLCMESGFSGVDSIQTKAVKTATGWQITGSKIISNEQLYSDKFLVFAKDEEGKLRLFVVPEEDVVVEEMEKTFASTKTVFNQINLEISLEDKRNVATFSDKGEDILALARTLIAAVSVGIAHNSLIKGIEVVKTTKDANNNSVSTSQSAQFTLADMFSELEAARMLTYYSADSMDKATFNIKIASMAKVKASEAAANVTMETMQLLGNVGFIANTEDFAPLIQRSSDCRIKGGTNRTHKTQIYEYMLAKK